MHSPLQSIAFQALILSFKGKIDFSSPYGQLEAVTDLNSGNLAETEARIPEFRKISPKLGVATCVAWLLCRVALVRGGRELDPGGANGDTRPPPRKTAVLLGR